MMTIQTRFPYKGQHYTARFLKANKYERGETQYSLIDISPDINLYTRVYEFNPSTNQLEYLVFNGERAIADSIREAIVQGRREQGIPVN
jgi:hypothetical protein